MQSRRVLVAADDERRRELRDELSRIGYEVVAETTDGVQALRLARRLRPDVAVLDARLPRLDAMQVAETMARNGIAPVVLASEPERTEDDLGSAIDSAVRQHQQTVELQQEVRAMHADPPLRALIRRAKSILMRRHGVSQPEAFARLQNDSLRTGRSLREVAAALVRPRPGRRKAEAKRNQNPDTEC